MKSESFCVEISGIFAMFATPASKHSCEVISYPMPTYSAMRAWMENIYWRPGIKWVIEKVRVMNPIMYRPTYIKQPKTRVITYDAAKIYCYSMLENVKYQIQAHYEIDESNLNSNYSHMFLGEEIKHAIYIGGEKLIRLGKECASLADVSECRWLDGAGHYDDDGEGEKVFMFFDMYKLQSTNMKKTITKVIFCEQQMINGIVVYDQNMLKYEHLIEKG